MFLAPKSQLLLVQPRLKTSCFFLVGRMPDYSIRGLKVHFPYDAYPLQRNNALLESPTGTGKTLCLLCATVAWRQDMISKAFNLLCPKGLFHGVVSKSASQIPAGLQAALFGGQKPSSLMDGSSSKPDSKEGEGKPPPILYASRTHSQLQQAMREFRKMNIGLNLKCTVLGARGHQCCDPQVSKLSSGSVQSIVCRQKVHRRLCNWYNNYKRDYATKDSIEEVGRKVLDIEDLGVLGRGNGPCPYFLTRDVAEVSDVVFLPYNYLLDPKQREHVPVEFANSVVIFDEGHNIEQVCADAPSFEMLSSTLSTCKAELESAVALMLNMSDADEKKRRERGALRCPSLSCLRERCVALQKSMKLLENHLLQLQLPADGRSCPGKEIFTFLDKGCILQMNHTALTDALGDASDILAEEATKSNSKLTGSACGILKENIEKAFDTLGRPACGGPEYHTGFRVHYRQKKQRNMGFVTEIAFWCFSPAIAMMRLCQLGLTSVIVTSGTLSPMGTFACELRTKFAVRLENKHVIKPSQAWVGVAPVGPSGHPMDSSFKCREDPKYKEDLGNAMVNFARVVPDGLLVFFPSYAVMKSCLDHWRKARNGNASIFERIIRHKHIVEEPRDASLFQNAIDDYKRKLSSSSSNGCIFFSVCRGKVSEGMDFADDMGRAVVVCGVPYAMKTDPQVALKREVLDLQRRTGGTLSGQQWYTQMAIRAVNQAMGRVIRHKDDYGAIIMCDRRFVDKGIQNQVSSWLRDMNNVHQNFGSVMSTLTKFFGARTVSRPPPCPDPKSTGEKKVVRSRDTTSTSTVLSLPGRGSLKREGEPHESGVAKKPRLFIPPARDMQDCSSMSTLAYRCFGSKDVDPESGLLGILQGASEPISNHSRVKENPHHTPVHVDKDRIGSKPRDSKFERPNRKLVQFNDEKKPTSHKNSVKEELPLESKRFQQPPQNHPAGIDSMSRGPLKQHSEVRVAPRIGNPFAAHVKPKGKHLSKQMMSAKDLLANLKAKLSSGQYGLVVQALATYRKSPNEEEFVDTILTLLGNPQDSCFLPAFTQFLKHKSRFLDRLRAMGIDVQASNQDGGK